MKNDSRSKRFVNGSYETLEKYSMFNNSMALKISLGSGFEFNLHKKLALQAGPSFSYFITSATMRQHYSNGPIDKSLAIYPYTIGLECVARYKF
ncbi:MAG: hypothetical protein K2X86_11280 [Cytophagaceae bacterium]|nr:hypothetical protein [Cytophagaceae bacterium]